MWQELSAAKAVKGEPHHPRNEDIHLEGRIT